VPLIEGAKQSWTFYRDGINKTGSLSDLSQRPVLLDMIVKTLPILIASDTPINLPNLYRTYLINEIKRQKVLKRRQLLIREEDRLSLLQLLAADIYIHKIPAITFESARNYVEQKLNPPKHELEAHTRDFLTNSFLIRRGDEYHFSHKSILEYLVAAQLNEEIKSGIPYIFIHDQIESAILNFMKEFELDSETFWQWLNLTRDKAHGKWTCLGGNAATLLCALSQDALAGKDLSGTDLTGADLSEADLRGTNLERTYLNNVALSGAKYYREALISADISIIHITIYFVTERDKDTVTKGWKERDLLSNWRAVKSTAEQLFSSHGFYASVVVGLRDDLVLGQAWLRVEGAQGLREQEHLLANKPDIPSAIYYDQYEKLLARFPNIEFL
jgi:hypothetical protein